MTAPRIDGGRIGTTFEAGETVRLTKKVHPTVRRMIDRHLDRMEAQDA